jgi:hypothetical protein
MNVNEINSGTNPHFTLLRTGAPSHHSYRLDHHHVPEQVYIACRNRPLEAIGQQGGS